MAFPRSMPSYRHRDAALEFASALLSADHGPDCASHNLTFQRVHEECDCGLDEAKKKATEYTARFRRK